MLGILQRLDELEGAEKKVKAMDQVVAAINRQSRVRYELKLEDVLPRCAWQNIRCFGGSVGS